MIDAGIIDVLTQYNPQFNDATFLIDVLWTMTNIVSIHVGELIKDKQIDKYLIQFLRHKDPEVFTQALWGLANIAGENAIYRDILLSQSIVDRIVFYYK